MYSLASQRTLEQTTPTGMEASGTDKQTTTVENALEKITAFIPSEAIALYISGLGIFAPQSAHARWNIFWICLAFIPVFMFLSYLQNRKHGRPIPSTAIVLLLLFFAAVAFGVWAAAMPQTPFISLWKNAPQIAGFIVIPLAYVMSIIADLCDAVPK
jgi:hypothetical protein